MARVKILGVHPLGTEIWYFKKIDLGGYDFTA